MPRAITTWQAILLLTTGVLIGSNAWPLVLAFPTEEVRLGGVRRALGDWLDSHEVSVATRSAVVLATHEAVANAVEHGKAGHSVTIRGRVDDGNVIVEVSDEGDWREAVFNDEERGRGLMLIAGLMDDFELVSDQPGTTVRMARAATPQ